MRCAHLKTKLKYTEETGVANSIHHNIYIRQYDREVALENYCCPIAYP